jgi:dsRNA-specific ribonuclease
MGADDPRSQEYGRLFRGLTRRLGYTFSDAGRELAIRACTDREYARATRSNIRGGQEAMEYRGDMIFNQAIQEWTDALPEKDAQRIDRKRLVYFLQSNAFLSLVGARWHMGPLTRTTDRRMADSDPMNQMRVYADSLEALIMAVQVDVDNHASNKGIQGLGRERAKEIVKTRILPDPRRTPSLYRAVIRFCDAHESDAVAKGWSWLTHRQATMHLTHIEGFSEVEVEALEGVYKDVSRHASEAAAFHYAGWKFMRAHPWSLWGCAGPVSTRILQLHRTPSFTTVGWNKLTHEDQVLLSRFVQRELADVEALARSLSVEMHMYVSPNRPENDVMIVVGEYAFVVTRAYGQQKGFTQACAIIKGYFGNL